MVGRGARGTIVTRSSVDELKAEARAAHDAMEHVLEPARLRRLLVAKLLDDEESSKDLIASIGWVRFFTSLLETGVLQAVKGDVEAVATSELVKVREYRAVLEFYARVADNVSKDVPA